MNKRDYYNHRLIKISWLVSLFLNLFNWGLVIWRIIPAKDEIILHYTVYYGADRIGPAWQAVYLPVLGLIIIGLNLLIGYLFWPKKRFVSFIFNYLSIFLQVMLFISTVILVLVNV